MRFRLSIQQLPTVGPLQGDCIVWRWAAASKIGTSHIRSGSRLQDACVVSSVREDYLIAIVSDGAGSAKFGAYGAWLVCRVLTVKFRDWLRCNHDLPSNELLIEWIDDLRDKISSVAERRKSTPRQFAATLASILIAPDKVVSMHIGDSGVVGRRGSEWDVLCWPENGEYASTTYFVTDDPEPRLNIVRRPRSHDAFALFSDGVGDLALSYSERLAHPKFFEPMMRPIDISLGSGRLSDLSAKLGTYLASAPVCDRTDDDKTLILISGR